MQAEFDPVVLEERRAGKQPSPTQKQAFSFFFFFPGAVNAKLRVLWPLALAATKLLRETENKGASRCKVDSFPLIMCLFQAAASFRLRLRQNNL